MYRCLLKWKVTEIHGVEDMEDGGAPEAEDCAGQEDEDWPSGDVLGVRGAWVHLDDVE